MTTQTELAELVKSLRLHWIDQVQDEEADAEEKCCYLIGTAAADALEHQAKRIAELESLIKAVHKAKGRYHSQLAMCDLYDACGLPNQRPVK